jgi:hypothetical protein
VEGGLLGAQYDIYFGTTPSPPRLAANVELGPSTSSGNYKTYKVSNLKRGTTYYWKIVSRTMANMSRTGAVWNFRTSQ